MKNSVKTPQRLFGSAESRSEALSTEASFTQQEYGQVLESLLEAIGTKSYFNGRVITTHEGFSSLLTATLIVYRTAEGAIRDFVPVWWELTTFLGDPNRAPREELPNDFSFHSLRELFLEQ